MFFDEKLQFPDGNEVLFKVGKVSGFKFQVQDM